MSEAKLLERLRALEGEHLSVFAPWPAIALRNALPEIIEALERGALGARLLRAVEAGWRISRAYDVDGSCWEAGRLGYVQRATLPELLDGIEGHKATEQGAEEGR